MKTKNTLLIASAVLTIGGAFAQDTDKINVPFRDASKPRMVNIEVFNGSITVKAYNGNEAIVESTGRPSRRSHSENVPPGMHQIGPGRSGLDITEENNVINIRAGVMGSADITVQVPTQTSLKIRSMNGGKILVEGVSGEIDAQNLNGSVTLDRVTPNKTMSFSSMNGTIDVTLPSDVKANLKMKSDNGDIYSDFDVKLTGSSAPQVEDRDGRHRIRIDKTMNGTINGGGPEMSFVTFNGHILIHKK
jgi:DUF4097 and DUF4098 domain-containing protein YvlB